MIQAQKQNQNIKKGGTKQMINTKVTTIHLEGVADHRNSVTEEIIPDTTVEQVANGYRDLFKKERKYYKVLHFSVDEKNGLIQVIQMTGNCPEITIILKEVK